MNEYVISFINENSVYQEITLRGISEGAATAMATGLLTASFQQVGLTVKEVVDRAVTILPGQEPPNNNDELLDNTENTEEA